LFLVYEPPLFLTVLFHSPFFFIYYRFCFCLPHYTGFTRKEQGFAVPLRALALSRLYPFIMGVKNKKIQLAGGKGRYQKACNVIN